MAGLVICKKYKRDLKMTEEKLRLGNHLKQKESNWPVNDAKNARKHIYMPLFSLKNVPEDALFLHDEESAKELIIHNAMKMRREIEGIYMIQKTIRRHMPVVFKDLEIKRNDIKNFFRE